MSFIYHADNSEFFRKLMKSFLTEAGHQFEGSARGEDAVSAVTSGEADCVITGLQLADMTGEELVKRLIGSKVEAPVIVVTSNNDQTQKDRLKALGVKAVIQKSGDWKGDLSIQLANFA